MKIEEMKANAFVDKCYHLAESALKDKEIPKNMRFMLYTSFVGFVSYYGPEYVDLIYRSYKDTEFLFKDKDYIKKYETEKNEYFKNSTLEAFNKVKIHIVRENGKKIIADAKYSVVLEKKYDINILIDFVHELNHVINSKCNKIINTNSKNILRVGIEEFSINQETSRIERRNNLLNESFNQLQTMEIIDEILLIYDYNIKNPYIFSCLEYINSQKERIDGSKIYSGPRELVTPIYNDKKFKSMYIKNCILGNLDAINNNFMTYTDSSIYEFGDLIEEIFSGNSKKESHIKANSLIKKYTQSVGKN